ncbi:hypothetical protein JCM21531_4300 [Acetivibrio straminisolvens JCM 21531]|uniref:Uncharacterized protein n=1 Tax=Acetivibrio straminisolvens JCM 21531 TaxID=1294263 RepID=W4VD38_9FIRM|nr:hypothetical protein JCM21531_4300 [Acetivibrio straminisolvens JCM 21531]
MELVILFISSTISSNSFDIYFTFPATLVICSGVIFICISIFSPLPAKQIEYQLCKLYHYLLFNSIKLTFLYYFYYYY